MDNNNMIIGVGVVALVLVAGILAMTGSDIPTDEPITIMTERPAPALGAADAKVVLVEYGDFQCPACQAYVAAVDAVRAEFGDQVRIEFRHFPLPMHPNARIASEAAEAAFLQGKFWEMYHKLYEEQKNWSELREPKGKFLEYATALGLDVVKFEADLSSPDVRGAVQADKAAGVDAGVSYTPYFILNGKNFENPDSADEFKDLVRNALAAAGGAGVPTSATASAPVAR